MKPLAIDPMDGPIKGPKLQNEIARPRHSRGKRSAITPAPSVRGPDPPMPAMNRQTIKVSTFVARAHPICQNIQFAKRRRTNWYRSERFGSHIFHLEELGEGGRPME